MFRRTLIAALASLSLTACQSEETSESKAIFAKNDMKLVTADLWSNDKTAQAVGTLLDVLDIQGQIITKSYCTAFRISPRHILTAAHCVKPGGRKVFEPKYLAASVDANKLEVISLGATVRAMFNGALDTDTQSQSWKNRPDLPQTAAHINTVMDYAILDLGYDLGEGYLKIEDLPFETAKLKLYGFQNGTPLSIAANCEGQSAYGVLRHDCDSLTGSSGGLIVDENDQPVALHTFSIARNLAGDHVTRGEFEDHGALKTIGEGSLVGKSDDQLNSVFWECRDLLDETERTACRLSGGLNRATLLTTIKNDLLKQNPDLHQEIFAEPKNEETVTEIDSNSCQNN